MAIPYRITGGHSRRSPLPLPTARALLAAVVTGAVLSILCVLSFTDSLPYLRFQPSSVDKRDSSRKYLYWGARVDCPGKHCGSCAGLGHQESSLRCALEEALFLDRFMECKDRTKRSSVMLPYTFLPTMPARKLRVAANKIKEILGDYDAIHVRRGDLLKNRKDRFGVERSLHPHLDRDTRPEFIKRRIAKWIPKGRTLFIASNERTPGFFSPLSDRYKLAYSSNFSSILEPIIENNYQLFMVERLIMQGAKVFVKTMRELDSDLALCDDPKKNTKVWEEPVLH